MKKFLQMGLLFFFCIVQTTQAAENPADTAQRFLALSDLHFNPYESCAAITPCPLISALRKASANQWPAILRSYQKTPVSYGNDPNYPALQSALLAAGKQKTKFVVVLGDYLAHDYQENYQKFSGDFTTAGYQAFVKKTQQFVTQQLAQTFPAQNVFLAVGNNDSYAGDYESEANGAFYHDMAVFWSGLLKDAKLRAAMQKQFVVGGYYAVTLPEQQNLYLIVLNSVLFSTKAQGTGVEQAAAKQLQWLQTELAATHARQQKALIIMHVPAGVDVYASLKKNPFQLTELWKSQYTQLFQQYLQQYAGDISGILAGHLHMDFFQAFTTGYPQPVFVSGVPAVSPLFGNNPGFKVYNYDSRSLALLDFTTYIHPLNSQTEWVEEYRFNQVYQPDCQNCRLLDGMALVKPTGGLAESYIRYFSDGTQSQPIAKGKWLPYYWCLVGNLTVEGYSGCLGSVELKKI